MFLLLYGTPQTSCVGLRSKVSQGHGCLADITEYEIEPDYSDNKEMVVRYTNAKGEARVHGGTDLKGSQSYPKKFGEALSKVRSKYQKKHHREAMAWLRQARRCERDYDRRPRLNRAWVTGANLQPVLDFLSAKQ